MAPIEPHTVINISIAISSQGSATVQTSLGDSTGVPIQTHRHVNATIGSNHIHDSRPAEQSQVVPVSPSIKESSSSIANTQSPPAKTHHFAETSSSATTCNSYTHHMPSSTKIPRNNNVVTGSLTAKERHKGVNKWTQASLPTRLHSSNSQAGAFVYSVLEITFDPQKDSSLEHPNPSYSTRAVCSTNLVAKTKAVELWDAFIAADRFDIERQIVEHGEDIDGLFWWKVSDKDSFVSLQTMVRITRTRLEPPSLEMVRDWVQPSVEQARTFPRRISKKTT